MPIFRPRLCESGTSSACAACASTISSATASCIIAAACRSTAAEKLAPVMAELGWHLQLWIDVKDLPADNSCAEIVRPAGRDRSHGPHRCPRRHRHRRFSEPACAQSATAGAGQSCRARIASAGNAPDYPDARPFHEALVRANPEAAGLGRRLAASARRGRDARCRASARTVSDVDAGSGDAAAHSRRPIPQSSMASRTESYPRQ